MSAFASTVPAQSMEIAKVKEHIDAIVTGIDLAQPTDAATQTKLYDAAVENLILVISWPSAHYPNPAASRR